MTKKKIKKLLEVYKVQLTQSGCKGTGCSVHTNVTLHSGLQTDLQAIKYCGLLTVIIAATLLQSFRSDWISLQLKIFPKPPSCIQTDEEAG